MSDRTDVLWTVGTVATAVLASALAVIGGPHLIEAMLALAFSLVAVRRPGIRLGLVSLGGLLILQSSTAVSGPKLGYFGFVLLCWLVSLGRLINLEDRELRPVMTPLLASSSLFLGVVLLSAPVARANGIPLGNWARDALPYALLGMMPLIGVDAAMSLPSKVMLRLVTAAGLLAALGFAVDFLHRRGASTLGVPKFTLATIALIAAPFCYAIVLGSVGTRRSRWLLLAAVLAGSVLVTGSRSGLVLFIGVLGVVGAATKGRVPLPSLSASLIPLTLLVAVLTPLVAFKVSQDPTFFQRRVAAATSVLGGNRADDPSYRSRVFQYNQASEQLHAHPATGSGPGHLYATDNPEVPTAFTLDTPLATPAKFGLVGTGLLIIALLRLVNFGSRLRRAYGPTFALTAARGFALIFLADLPFGGFLEDKGLSLALGLLLGLALAQARENPALEDVLGGEVVDRELRQLHRAGAGLRH